MLLAILLMTSGRERFGGQRAATISMTRDVEALRDVKLDKPTEALKLPMPTTVPPKAASGPADTEEQKAMAEQLAVLRSCQADAERARTEITEMVTRVKLQLADIEAAVKNAHAASELCLAETEAEKKDLNAAVHEVEELKTKHTDLVTQLYNLRAEFKHHLESNRRLAHLVRGRSAFVWANDPTAGSYMPNSTYSFNPSGGAITITHNSTGSYTVRFAGLGVSSSPAPQRGGIVQATAYGFGSETAKVVSWDAFSTDFTVNVNCFNSSGSPVDTKYTVLVILP